MLKLTQISLANLILTLFFGFASLSVAWAQEPLQQGYYISLNGDTTYAFIGQRGKVANALQIRFFSDPEAEAQVFYPADLKSYGIAGGDHYESHTVQVNTSSFKESRLTESPSPSMKTQSLFLNVYVKGLMSLYFFQDDDDNKHFYIQKMGQDSLIPLINYRYKAKKYVGARVMTTLKHKKRYINQLAVYMSDCAEIQKEFLAQKHNKLAWKEQDIQAFIIRYNQLMNAEIVTFKSDIAEKNKPILQFGIVAGVSVTDNNFVASQGSVSSLYWSADFETAIDYLLGLSIHLQQKNNRGRWGFQGDIFYDPIRLESYAEVGAGTSRSQIHQMSAVLDYLRIGTSVRFNPPVTGKVKPFLQLGLTQSFLVQGRTSRRTDSNFFGIENSEIGPIFEEQLRGYDWGVNVGVGTVRDHLLFKVGFDYGLMGFSPIIGVGSPRKSLFAMVGVNL